MVISTPRILAEKELLPSETITQPLSCLTRTSSDNHLNLHASIDFHRKHLTATILDGADVSQPMGVYHITMYDIAPTLPYKMASIHHLLHIFSLYGRSDAGPSQSLWASQ